MSLKSTLNAFNRVKADISIVQLLNEEALNTVLFVGTEAEHNLKSWSGAVTSSEIETEYTASTNLSKKIELSLKQKTALGASILPDKFFACAKLLGADRTALTEVEKTAFRDWLELTIKNVVVDQGKRFCCVVFDNLEGIIDDDDFLIELCGVIADWGCVAFIQLDDKDNITDSMRADLTNTYFIKSHKFAEDNFELGADAALAGRVVYLGAGYVDGVAKELVGITADKASIAAGDGGDLTATEAQEWIDAGVNLYTQTTELYNETTGISDLDDENFTNTWALLKVASDLSSDLSQLRHQRDKMSTGLADQATVRATIVNRLAILKRQQYDAVTNSNIDGIIYDYQVANQDLDYSLESNKGKFAFTIRISLSQDAKWFELGIVGYKDGRLFEVEGV